MLRVFRAAEMETVEQLAVAVLESDPVDDTTGERIVTVLKPLMRRLRHVEESAARSIETSAAEDSLNRT